MFPIGAMSIALAGLVDGEPTPERILREAARLGLDGVEFYESDWGGSPGDLEEAACLAETAAAAGVRLFAIGSAARLGYHDGRAAAALETLRRQVDVAAAVGARSVTFAAIDSQPLPAGRDPAEGGLPFAGAAGPLVRQMRELAEYAGERQVQVALLNHGSFACTSWHQEWVVRLVDAANAGACLDPGNYLYYEGEDPVAATRRLRGRVAAVRLGDWRPRDAEAVADEFAAEGRLSPWEAAVFGEGEVDHAACLRLLREAGYDGWLSIKSAGSSPRGPEDALRRTLDNIRQLAASIDGGSP